MISFREALQDDAQLLWEWANEEDVRENAYDQSKIPWENHIDWLSKKLKSNKCFIFIAEIKGEAIGQIRFDLKDSKNALVDVSIANEQRGEGYGSMLIRSGTDHFFKYKSRICVHAFVKKGNIASKKAFDKAGYHLQDIENVKGYESYHLVKKHSL